ncbi:hypothetical protein [Gemmatimonas groenlandica]|uniref:Uncharacterized protein n=1 Tax=Gemmatimonas groenlandica TaxID=2732249 RepID=A0A6M4IHZ3_9BACT|nr:hypothetical protein [Gemmatimonas groenlandica]QJR34423.1 hypothetical protein HKW67_02240 [Gemmatimonas groenlandica]
MMMTIPRAAFGVFALLFTVATVDVSRAMAQSSTVTSTACSMGTLTACGTQPITTCETSIQFNLNVFMQSGGFTFTQTKCVAGYKTLYKDRTSISTGTTTTGPFKTCSAATTSGSSDDGFEANIELCED